MVCSAGCRILAPLALLSFPRGWGWSTGLYTYSLDLGFDCCYCDPCLPKILRGDSPWLYGCHWSVRGGVCSLISGVESPIYFLAVLLICGSSDLVGLEHTNWERNHWGLLLWGYAPWSMLCGSSFMCCVSSHVTLCWHWSWPHLNHGHDGTWPWCLSDVVFTRSPA